MFGGNAFGQAYFGQSFAGRIQPSSPPAGSSQSAEYKQPDGWSIWQHRKLVNRKRRQKQEEELLILDVI